MIKLEPMESFPPEANPFLRDHLNMGTFLAENVVVMYTSHPTQKASYLIVLNKETGERVKLWFGPGHNGIWNERHRNSRNWLDSLEGD